MTSSPAHHVTVVALHGLMSHPDILSNACRRIEAATDRNIGTDQLSWSFPAGSVPIARPSSSSISGSSSSNVKTSAAAASYAAETGDATLSAFASLQLLGWILPRTDNDATTATEFRTAFEIVLADIQEHCNCEVDEATKQKQFFVLFGFSQGGMISLLLLEAIFSESPSPALAAIFSSEEKQQLRALFRERCLGVILAGTPMPQQVEAHQAAASSPRFPFPSLHCVGDRDKLVVPESQLVAANFFAPAKLFRYSGGHAIPLTSECSGAFVSFLLEQVMPAAEKRALTDEEREARAAAERARMEELKALLEEEAESLCYALPEGSSAVLEGFDDRQQQQQKSGRKNKNSNTKQATPAVIVKLVLPGLEDETTRRACFNVGGAAASLLDKKMKKQQQHQQNDDEDEDDDEDDYFTEAARTASTLSGGGGAVGDNMDIPSITLTIPIARSFPDEAPRCSVGNLPPLLALQPHRRAALTARIFDASLGSTGMAQGMVTQIALSAVSELEDWVQKAVEQVQSGGGADSNNEEDEAAAAAAAAAIANPWLKLDEQTYEERAEMVKAAYADVDPMYASGEFGGGGSTSAAATTKAARGGGKWKFTVGCVGKPSVGKSRIFNALCDPEPDQAAKCAAHPFTTIDPQLGAAFAPIPCPCSLLVDDENNGNNSNNFECAARYGHVETVKNTGDENTKLLRFRRHPINVLDVAGLVPGAYQGRGRGNFFLNSLTGADVLLLVLDASERSDADGNIFQKNDDEDSDNNSNTLLNGVVENATWLRFELVSWIFNNVAAQWQSIRRRPNKLLQMFSGYQASQHVVELALERCGVKLSELDVRIPSWTPDDLARLVCHFQRIRFPIVFALNKCDMLHKEKIVEKKAELEAAFPGHAVVPVSALTECELLALRRSGTIQRYVSGDADFVVAEQGGGAAAAAADKKTAEKMNSIREVLRENGGTGIQQLLAAAIAQQPPVLCYTLECDLDTVVNRLNAEKELQQQTHQQKKTQVLRDCVALRRGTTADGAFKAAASMGVLDGSAASAGANNFQHYSLVRCDVVALPLLFNSTSAAGGATFRRTVCRKDDVLPPTSLVKLVGKKG